MLVFGLAFVCLSVGGERLAVTRKIFSVLEVGS